MVACGGDTTYMPGAISSWKHCCLWCMLFPLATTMHSPAQHEDEHTHSNPRPVHPQTHQTNARFHTQVPPIKPHRTLPPPACTSLPTHTHAIPPPPLCKHPSPNHPSPRSLVITLAQSKMLEVFGLEMREITKAPQRGANKGAAGKHLYNMWKHWHNE